MESRTCPRAKCHASRTKACPNSNSSTRSTRIRVVHEASFVALGPPQNGDGILTRGEMAAALRREARARAARFLDAARDGVSYDVVCWVHQPTGAWPVHSRLRSLMACCAASMPIILEASILRSRSAFRAGGCGMCVLTACRAFSYLSRSLSVCLSVCLSVSLSLSLSLRLSLPVPQRLRLIFQRRQEFYQLLREESHWIEQCWTRTIHFEVAGKPMWLLRREITKEDPRLCGFAIGDRVRLKCRLFSAA